MPPSISSRQYPAHPLLGVGALIFQETVDQRNVLLVERGRPPLQGYWSLPGGLVETGERLEDALIREVAEETGLAVKPGRIATVFERIMPEESGRCEYHFVLVDFYCDVEGGKLEAGDDSSNAAWVAVSDLPGMKLTEGTKAVIEACCSRPPTNGYVARPEVHAI